LVQVHSLTALIIQFKIFYWTYVISTSEGEKVSKKSNGISSLVGAIVAVTVLIAMTKPELGGAASTPGDGGKGEGLSSGSVAELAQKIKNTRGITYQNDASREAIRLAAAGQKVPVDRFGRCGNDWCRKVYLSPKMLGVMLGLSNHGYRFEISSIADGFHDTKRGKVSEHYDGTAFDVSKVNGRSTNPTNSRFRQFFQTAFDIMPSGGGLGQSHCPVGRINTHGRNFYPDDCTHVHIGVGLLS
jgi:hypothetical protein